MKNEALQRLFETIESHEFASKVGVASRFSTLEEMFRGESATQALLHLTARQKISALDKRLRVLCSKQIDERYTNPWDFAITAYLWILWMEEAELEGVLKVVAQTGNLWWGKYLSDYLTSLQAEFMITCSRRTPSSWDYDEEVTLSKPIAMSGREISQYDKNGDNDYKLAA